MWLKTSIYINSFKKGVRISDDDDNEEKKEEEEEEKEGKKTLGRIFCPQYL